MKIHMDYLEGKVEKQEKEQQILAKESAKNQIQFEQLSQKLKLLKIDRDDQSKLCKRLKDKSEENKVHMMNLKAENLKLNKQLEANLTRYSNHHSQSGSTNFKSVDLV